MRLTLRQLSVYLNHIPVIMAKEAMTQSVISSMPHMDEETRAEVLRDWAAIAGTDLATADPISEEDFREDIK